MANLGNLGNLQNVEEQEGFELRPPGDYPVRINDTDLYDKDGNNVLKIEFEYVDGTPGKIWVR